MATNPRKPRTATGRRSGAPTISDVATLAGVSPMTVSRVINGEAKVRDATRETVNAAIATLHYAPNRAARSLAGGGQMRIGLLYSNPSSAYLSEFLVGSLEQASRSDVQLVVEKCDIGDHEIEVAEHMIRSGVDGVILPPPLCDSRGVLDVLIAAGVPTVVVATGSPPADTAAVTIDDFEAARAMTRHLIGLGHARVGFIIGNPNQTASQQRHQGYLAAIADAGAARGSVAYRRRAVHLSIGPRCGGAIARREGSALGDLREQRRYGRGERRGRASAWARRPG